MHNNFGPTILGFLAVILLFGICSAAYNFGTAESETVTIADTWTKIQDDQDKYLVSTNDGRVFEITDSLLRFQFRSSDIYAKMTSNKGKQFNIEYYGWRIGFVSFYPNIYNATLIDQ